MESMRRNKAACRTEDQPPAESKETGPQSYNLKKLTSINNLKEPGSGFSPRAFRQEPSPDTLISAL